jgi:hypothetical protein
MRLRHRKPRVPGGEEEGGADVGIKREPIYQRFMTRDGGLLRGAWEAERGGDRGGGSRGKMVAGWGTRRVKRGIGLGEIERARKGRREGGKGKLAMPSGRTCERGK